MKFLSSIFNKKKTLQELAPHEYRNDNTYPEVYSVNRYLYLGLQRL